MVVRRLPPGRSLIGNGALHLAGGQPFGRSRADFGSVPPGRCHGAINFHFQGRQRPVGNLQSFMPRFQNSRTGCVPGFKTGQWLQIRNKYWFGFPGLVHPGVFLGKREGDCRCRRRRKTDAPGHQDCNCRPVSHGPNPCRLRKNLAAGRVDLGGGGGLSHTVRRQSGRAYKGGGRPARPGELIAGRSERLQGTQHIMNRGIDPKVRTAENCRSSSLWCIRRIHHPGQTLRARYAILVASPVPIGRALKKTRIRVQYADVRDRMV